MKKFLVLAISLIAFASCEKDPDMSQLDSDFTVYTNYDSEAQFGSFTSYCLPDSILLVGNGMKASYWKDENAQKIISAVAEEMENCGYVRVDEPDQASVGLQLSYAEQTTYVTSFVGGMYGSWWDFGFWGPYWGGWYYPYPISYSYETGTLIMEMVDLTNRSTDTDGDGESNLTIVWHAYSDGLLYGSSRIDMQLVLRAVEQAFAQSPYLNILDTNE